MAEILASSDAFRRGIEIGDEISQFGGRDIQTVNQFKNVLGIYPKGWRVPITVIRSGVDFQTTVRLMGVHSAEQLTEIVQGRQSIESPRSPENPPQEGPGQIQQEDREEQAPQDGFESLFVARRGFANYYFNQLERDRVWSGFLRHGDFTKQDFDWRIKAEMENQEVTLVLGREKSGMQVGEDIYVLDPDEDLATQLVPPQTGGLLVALHLWRKLLVESPSRFGDVIYFGSLNDPRVKMSPDALVATFQSVECNFLFDPTNQMLMGMEFFPELNSDPCVISFSDYLLDRDTRAQTAPLTVPGEIRFSSAGKKERTLKVIQIEFLNSK